MIVFDQSQIDIRQLDSFFLGIKTHEHEHGQQFQLHEQFSRTRINSNNVRSFGLNNPRNWLCKNKNQRIFSTSSMGNERRRCPNFGSNILRHVSILIHLLYHYK